LLLTMAIFLNISTVVQKHGLRFSTVKGMLYFWHYIWLGYILGDFFTISSGHPDRNLGSLIKGSAIRSSIQVGPVGFQDFLTGFILRMLTETGHLKVPRYLLRSAFALEDSR
jgi:hypothetical protein